jgi:SAM-dependent methyltransferase
MKKAAFFDEYALAKPMPLSVPDALVPWIQALLGGKILDAGCGDGRFLEFCAAVAPQSQLVGLDISRVRTKRVTDKGFIALQSDNERLPFTDESFHLVLLIEVIEHVQHPETVIAEVTRVLRPEGRLILTTPNYPIKRVYDWLQYLQGARHSPADDPTHFSPFSARRIRRLCSRHFASVESQIHRIAGEGRWPVLARLKKSPGTGDWVGHKVALLCQHPRIDLDTRGA